MFTFTKAHTFTFLIEVYALKREIVAMYLIKFF